MSGEQRRDSRLRALPSVERLAVELARATLAERRAELLSGAADEVDLVERALGRLAPTLRPVINATGVIVHTNLGRAPLARAARAAVARAAGYCNLELDLEDGRRGSRHAHVEGLLCELTGAEAAIAVNNGAGAALLAAAALAGGGRELVVSRGQLIEIGGGFRIPEVVAQAGAHLVEVGTTNRTRIDDYRRALGPATGALLRVHTSNFRAVGFVEQVEVEELCALGPPVIDDVGSGVLATDPDRPDAGEDGNPLLADEPPVRRSVAAGAALVCFSGDKLLGGPQAGLLVGRAEAVARARSHPLARALRIDKLSLAALEVTLGLYRDPELARREIPTLAMLFAGERELAARAEQLAHETGGTIARGDSRVGGGALPLLTLAGPVVMLTGDLGPPGGPGGPGGPSRLARELRLGDPAVLTRVHRDAVVLDPRTLEDAQVAVVGEAVRAARRRLLEGS